MAGRRATAARSDTRTPGVASAPAAAPPPDAPETRADWVDRRLRAAILAGELAPGTKLVAGPLAQRFAVSATPLREAIQRLAATGLVEVAPQRGARVAAASAHDAEEIYELRTLLEPLALRDSLAHTDPEHRTAIADAFARLARAGSDGADAVETLDRHAAFHATLLARCRSRWLLRLTGLLADHSQRYAFLAAGGGAAGGHHDVLSEHRALRDAALAGRSEHASSLLEEHLQRTLAGIRSIGHDAPSAGAPARRRRRNAPARAGGTVRRNARR